MNKAGIQLEEQNAEKEKSAPSPKKSKQTKTAVNKYDDKSIEDLENLLKMAIEQENYELASDIRDEISRREK